MRQDFELRKLRDFGQVFNDTFIFFKNNLKPLMRPILVICGIFILISTVNTIAGYFNVISAFAPDPNTYGPIDRTVSMYTSLIISSTLAAITQTCISLVTLCYISVYLQNNKQEPALVQVWGYFRYYFWRVFGASILLAILTAIGGLFCVIPGIYLGAVFSMVMPIIVMENASFGYAFNKSFRLIRANWWFVFGTLIVMAIIIVIAYEVAGLPLSIMAVSSKFLTVRSVRVAMVIFFSIMQNMLILTFSLSSIAVALCYFDLVEQKESIGILSRIENFGKREVEESTGDQQFAEEY